MDTTKAKFKETYIASRLYWERTRKYHRRHGTTNGIRTRAARLECLLWVISGHW